MKLKTFREIIAEVPQGGNLLEIGCGTGLILRGILKYRKDLNLYAIDIEDFSSSVQGGAVFKKADAEKEIPFEENMFDAVICFHVIEHLHNPKNAITEVWRVLKGGGIVIAESPHWRSTIKFFGFNFWDDPTHIRPYSPKSFSSLFSEFTVKQVGITHSIHSAIAGGLSRLAKTIVFIVAQK